MTGTVYALQDPRTMEIRYVGFSTYLPGKRAMQHIWEARHRRRHPVSVKAKRPRGKRPPYEKYDWLMELDDAGLAPIIVEILHGVAKAESDHWELLVMSICERCGNRLTNERRNSEADRIRRTRIGERDDLSADQAAHRIVVAALERPTP